MVPAPQRKVSPRGPTVSEAFSLKTGCPKLVVKYDASLARTSSRGSLLAEVPSCKAAARQMQRTSILNHLMSLMACDMVLRVQDTYTLADFEHRKITSREATYLGTSLTSDSIYCNLVIS